MNSSLESRWTHEDTLKAFNPFRELFRDASSELVRSIFQKYLRSEDRIIEIGSGLGELVNLVPEYRNQIQQTEQSEKIAEGNRTLNPDSNIKIANVYDLPFPDNSFEVAVGYSVFDTLEDIESALTEVSRVLSPHGMFMHFLDCYASANTFFHKYENTGKIPFPFCELDKELGLFTNSGLQLVEQKDLPKVREAFHPRLRFWFDGYVKNPELMYVTASAPELNRSLGGASEDVRKSGVKTTILRFNDEFAEDLEKSLKSAGYRIVEAGNMDGLAIAQRNGRHSQNPEYNMFHNDLGLSRSRYDLGVAAELKPDKVKIVSTLYVAVGEKLD
ncbi:class I SAM-dependent methyltransferase [candidate division KSB1 bacterium]